MPKAKKWVFTKGRQESIKVARAEHSRLVELGLKVRGSRSKAKRVRVGRQLRDGD